MAADRFTDRVVVITGGARGLGAVVASTLVREGAAVALLDLSDELDATASRLADEGADVLAVPCDVTQEESVVEAGDAVLARFGRCDVLVSNAGIVARGPVERLGVDDWDRVVDVNLRGCFLVTRTFGSLMLDRGAGSIVAVASIAHDHPGPGGGAYAATKAAVVTFMAQIAVEWGPRGVRANVVSPGLMDSRMGRSDREVAIERGIVPLGRMGALEEVAAAVTFLASDDASYINGVDLAVDGGLGRALMREVHRSPEGLAPR